MYQNLKLGVGERIALLVDTQEQVTGQYGEQYRISGTRIPDGEKVCFYAPMPQWDKQVEKMGVDTTAGIAIDVHRKPMEGSTTKAFWNVYRNNGSAPSMPAPKAAAPAAPALSTAGRATWPQISMSYRECIGLAAQIAQGAEVAELPTPTYADIVAMAATLFIQRAHANAWASVEAPKPAPTPRAVAPKDDDDLPF